MKSILCFGDSNTWGYIPLTAERLPRTERWTGRLQKALGEEYHVIEAGLNARTTAFDDPLQPYRNGLKAVRMTLLQEDPLDMIIIMLGTNDTKNYLALNADAICGGMRLLLREIFSHYFEQNAAVPKILLVAPIDIAANISSLPTGTEFDERSVRMLEDYRKLLKSLAEETGCAFLDAGQLAAPSPLDGLHLTKQGHALLAEALEACVRSCLGAD